MLKPCEEWNERLSAFLDGEVDTTERLVVLQHLESCPACRAAAEILRCDAQDVSAVLSARGAGEGFAGRVMAQVAVTPMGEPAEAPEQQPQSWLDWLVRRHRGQLIALIGAGAGVLLLILVGVMNFGPGRYSQSMRVGANTAPVVPASPPATTTPAPNTQIAGKPMPPPTQPAAAGQTATGPVPITTGRMTPIPGPPGISAGNNQAPAPSQPTIIPPELNYGLADKLMIAYTAEMSLRTKTVDRAMESAELLFRKYDGFVLNTQYNRDEKGKATAVVNGRVPSEKLGQLLVDLDGLGELQARTVNGEDLTAKQLEQIEQLGDLALKQQFLSKIESRDNRYTVESQREAARSKGTGLRVDEYKLKNRVTLANVTVKISSPPVKKPKPNAAKASAQKSFRGLRAFGMWILSAILIPLGIWLPVWGPLTIVGIVLRRRVLRRRASSGSNTSPQESNSRAEIP